MDRPHGRAGRASPRGIRIAVNTQTPLIRFRDEVVLQAGAGPISLSGLREPDDYKFTTGGVTRMILPLLRRWLADGAVARAEWVAMAAGERAPRLAHEGVDLAFVGLPPGDAKGYARVKERMWALLNSNPSTPVPHGEGGIPERAWSAFDRYQAASADALAEAADRMGRLDLLYVHDFQQIGVGEAWKGPRVPKLFHLHTPFPSVLPGAWTEYFLARLRAYDAVVVSTRRYAANLRAAGFDRPLHVIPPFIDPDDYPAADAARVAAFRDRFGLREDDEVVLNVGRMDPMKGQDRLIRAMPALLRARPQAKLVLVGNGSFSSSRKGGLGLSKGARWRESLETLAKELGVQDRVVFTGHLGDDLLPAAYEACRVFCLPSTREGFGLAAIEAWRHRRPVVVSDRAGVAELVLEGRNGQVVDCAEPAALSGALAALLADPDAARRMGDAGREDSEVATLPQGRLALEGVFAELLEVERVAA
ncbi:MAG TPA: glycosyltransferase family 4 protein [Candidatus Thermoplasmatota archaeon]|nr:glycosyltransferase family 4 protein [Candidatus Thermoplasmatota archaeon]